MDRRQFLTITTVGALGAIAAVNLSRDGDGPAPRPGRAFEGTIFINVHVGGGWDPRSLCDPHGDVAGEIETVGNLSYAPLGDATHPHAGRDFFVAHHGRLLVINGIDTSTDVCHDAERHIGTGALEPGYPSFGAFYAAATGRDLPIAYLSFGGFDETAGLVTRTRSGTSNALAQLAPAEASAKPRQETPATDVSDPIKGALGRLQAQRVDPSRLAAARAALGSRFARRVESVRFDHLRDYLPEHLDTSDNPLFRQAQVALAAVRAGLTTACNLYLSSSDADEDVDARQLIQLLEGIDFLWREAGRLGVQDRLVISFGSGCGRPPGTTTSMMLMGRGIAGNRVVGATDGRSAVAINATSLAPDASGIRLAPRHVHQNLRRLVGISSGDLDARFPLHVPPSEDPHLFG